LRARACERKKGLKVGIGVGRELKNLLDAGWAWITGATGPKREAEKGSGIRGETEVALSQILMNEVRGGTELGRGKYHSEATNAPGV